MLFGFAQRAAASADRVFEVLDQPPAIADPPGAVALPAPSGGPGPGRRVAGSGVRITFEDVRFAYEEGAGPPWPGSTSTLPRGPGWRWSGAPGRASRPCSG